MKHVALVFDEPTSSRTIFPKSMMEKFSMPIIKEYIKDERMFICSGIPTGPEFPMHDVVAIVNDSYIEGNRLIVDFEFVKNNPLAHAVQEELNRGNVKIEVAGAGIWTWNGETGRKQAFFVNEFEVTCFYFIPNYNDSY